MSCTAAFAVQGRPSGAFAAEYGREIPCAQQAEDGLLSRPEFS